MAGIDFHEILLDVEYAPGAVGGSSFSNGVLDAPSRVIQLAANSLKDLWKGSIDFSLLTDPGLEALYSFFLCRGGGRCGFRFLPPKFNKVNNSLIAIADGTETSLKLYKEDSDGLYTHRKRICKPAWGTAFLTLDDEFVGVSNGAGGIEIPTYGQPLYGELNPELIVNLDYTTGIITPQAGTIPAGEWRWSGQIHLPVRFTSNDFTGKYDTSSSWGQIGIEELLPKSLGLS